jgi:hypothetical protein
MKKLCVLFVITIVLLGLVACDDKSVSNPSIETTSEATTQTNTTTDIETTNKPSATTLPTTIQNESFTKPKITWNIPEYVPGSIKQHDAEYYEIDSGHPILYRYVWYGLHSEIYGLVDKEKCDIWLKDTQPQGVAPSEMVAVSFVKYFNISKEDFEKAIEESRKVDIKLGKDLTHKDYELPNADIIYTFDDEIINNYYRREK